MEQNTRNSGSGTDGLFGQLAAEKKKTIIALCLIAVMALMWVRVLGKKGPNTAGAALRGEEVIEGQSNSELKISFIELPNVKGRNDVLIRDFFTADGGDLSSAGGVNVVSRDGGGEVIRRIAEKLKLEAIGLGGNPQAFINDKLLAVGDKLPIVDRGNTYECEVIGIEENTVSIRCGEAEITLKLTQANEVAD